MIYLDNAATTFPKPECVYEALDKANREYAFNAGHGESNESQKAMDIVNLAREAVASLVPGTLPNQVVFTCSATESLNIIINGLDLAAGDYVYISPFEHNAIVRPLFLLASKIGIHIEILPFKKEDWSIDKTAMLNTFAVHHPAAVLLSQISNVTGYELPYAEIFEESKKYQCINVLDAAQGFGVFAINKPSLCSYIVFAGHKSLYASFGVAGFIKNGSDVLSIYKAGGTGSDSLNHDMPESMPSRYEAGSLNVVAISSLITSIDWLKKHDVAQNEIKLSAYFRDKLIKIDKAVDFMPKGVISHGIVSFAMLGYNSNDVGSILNSAEMSVRTGFHCAPLVHDFVGSREYSGTVRVSFGAFNQKDDADKLIDFLQKL